MLPIKRIISLTISALMLAVYIPIFVGTSTATAESPGFGKKCSHSQFLSKSKAKGGNGNWFQCSGSGISTTKSGDYKRYYSWVQVKNPTTTSDVKPGEICFTPLKTVESRFGKLKCLPVRVKPPLYMWVK